MSYESRHAFSYDFGTLETLQRLAQFRHQIIKILKLRKCLQGKTVSRKRSSKRSRMSSRIISRRWLDLTRSPKQRRKRKIHRTTNPNYHPHHPANQNQKCNPISKSSTSRLARPRTPSHNNSLLYTLTAFSHPTTLPARQSTRTSNKSPSTSMNRWSCAPP